MRSVISLVLLCLNASLFAQDHELHSFDRVQLSDVFFSEGAAIGDLNNDGKNDVVSGPYWYAGPDFKTKHEYYPAKPFDKAGYSDNFFAHVDDVNGDKWNDIVIIGFPGKEAFWYQNPQGKEGHWKRHLAAPVVDNESPHYTDLTGDGRKELVFHTKGRFGWAGPDPADPTKPWTFHPVTPDLKYQRFTHGMGVGDVNGDGALDILEKQGWWENAPLSNEQPEWTLHKYKFTGAGGAQMYAYDLDDDGDNDVITSLAAHQFGLAWFEQIQTDDGISFKKHLIMGSQPEENEYGLVFSQLHAVELIDMDGDGIKDIVTGKRHWAHGGHDPGGSDIPVSYWFKTVRGKEGVRFIPYQIDNASGVGTEVTVGDVNGDKLPDLVIGNKLGTFVLIHLVDKVDQKTWEKAQPKKLAQLTPEERRNAVPDATVPRGWPKGIAAKKPDGSPLNLDLETGDLTDWTKKGKAFEKQPAAGDMVKARRRDMVSRHQGRFWIGGFEYLQDPPTGTLTSAVGKITHPWASFLVGGGSHEETRVEIVLKEGDKVIAKSSGFENEAMSAVVVDLREHQGKEFYVRVIDQHTGHWGHVNYDQFRFHDREPKFPKGYSVLPTPAGPDHAGLDPEAAARTMTVPDGFKVITSAAEPDVRQPIAMALDDRGRVWVAEAYAYPIRRPEEEAEDRILIFEDTTGDGKLDSRKVFIEGLNLVSGLEVGFGGVWVGAAPYLLFIPDKDGDDKPDGKPQVLLDGWGYQDTHETLNAFIWGPDGWLYGCHGVFTHSKVGKPGTPEEQRVPLNAGIWRYHPLKHTFEVFAHGTSNPWGVDFNDKGQAFLACCVIPHLFHVVQEARYHRQGGLHFNPYTYDDIKTIANHRHWTGNQWNNLDRLNSNDLGGGHAHSGAMIYLGGAWPDKYRNELFMNNIHGARLNQDHLSRKGSGYVGDFAPDFLLANDSWSQIINMRYGPDGQVWMIDWYDAQQCHHRELGKHDRGNGRIFKVVYGDPQPVKVDLQKLNDIELVELQVHPNDWYVRHARRILMERGEISVTALERLIEILKESDKPEHQLRAMWALHVTGNFDALRFSNAIAKQDEYVRAWAIQLGLADSELGLELYSATLLAMAKKDPSQVVRLYLASAANRLPLDERWELMGALLAHSEDAQDHNLPLMYWYAVEPLVEENMERSLALVEDSAVPLVKQFTLRRIAETGTPLALNTLVQTLGKQQTADARLTYLNAISTALKGRRSVPMPKAWKTVGGSLSESPNGEVKTRARALAVTFGDPAALAQMRKILSDQNAAVPSRKSALESLLGAKDPQLAPTLQELLDEQELRREALRGLAAYEDPQTAPLILSRYAKYNADEKRDALNTLASRPGTTLALLKAIEADKIDSKDLSADVIRQMSNLNNKQIDKLIGEVWGIVRSSPEEVKKQIAAYQKLIVGKGTAPDHTLGRAVFSKTCQQCHKLFDAGNRVGPELTGANRGNLEYVLSNVLDPSAVMAKDYQPVIVVTDDGRTVTGLIAAENANAITLRTANDTVIVPRGEIEILKKSEKSMMPDNLWQKLSSHEVRSLVAYLASPGQVPLLATAENAGTFFNGKDLTGWTGNLDLWSVQDGTIVGYTDTGIKQNEFLFSDLTAGDFELTATVRLTPNTENSGIQFRSERLPDGHAKGYQADMGQGWWGKLYHEHGRKLLWDKPGDQYVKAGEWNEYRIRAEGHKIQTWINGELCVNLDDPKGELRGLIAFQIHSGGPMKIEIKNPTLKVLGREKLSE